MARVVVVSSSQLERTVLSEVVAADDELYVVVPAVEQSRIQWLTNDEAPARADARQVGEEIGLVAPGEPSDVEVKPDAPDQVVLDAIAEHKPDRIVVALREARSRPGSRKAASTSFHGDRRHSRRPHQHLVRARVARRTSSSGVSMSLSARVAEPAEYGEDEQTQRSERAARSASKSSFDWSCLPRSSRWSRRGNLVGGAGHGPSTRRPGSSCDQPRSGCFRDLRASGIRASGSHLAADTISSNGNRLGDGHLVLREDPAPGPGHSGAHRLELLRRDRDAVEDRQRREERPELERHEPGERPVGFAERLRQVENECERGGDERPARNAHPGAECEPRPSWLAAPRRPAESMPPRPRQPERSPSGHRERPSRQSAAAPSSTSPRPKVRSANARQRERTPALSASASARLYFCANGRSFSTAVDPVHGPFPAGPWRPSP